MKAKKSKARGRPAMAPAEKKRRNFTFRGTDELHEHVSKAAAESGRSMSEEIEWRLGQSFFTQEIVDRAVSQAIEATFAYVDRKREAEEAQRTQLRPFSDLLKGIEEDDK